MAKRTTGRERGIPPAWFWPITPLSSPAGPSLHVKHKRSLHAASAPSQDRTDRSSAPRHLTPGRGDHCSPPGFVYFLTTTPAIQRQNRGHFFMHDLQQRGIQRKKIKILYFARTKVIAQAFTWVALERLGELLLVPKSSQNNTKETGFSETDT